MKIFHDPCKFDREEKKQITYFQGKFDAMHQKLKTRILQLHEIFQFHKLNILKFLYLQIVNFIKSHEVPHQVNMVKMISLITNNE